MSRVNLRKITGTISLARVIPVAKRFLAAFLIVGLFEGMLLVPTTAQAAWYGGSWSHRISITVAHTQVGSTLTDFPVYVDLSTLPADFHANVKSDGSDIRVTAADGTTEVPREVVSYSAGTDSGEVYFKAPSLSSSSDTVFYIYYGNAAASEPATTATYGRDNVWSNGFGGVWHMGTATLVDSTGQVGDSTSNTGTITTTSRFGTATDYSGASQRSIIPDASSINADVLNSLTYTLWLQGDSFTRSMEKGDQYFLLNIAGAGEQGPLVKINASNKMADSGSLSTGTWYMLGGRYSYAGGSSGVLDAIKNGSLIDTTTGLTDQIDSSSKGLYLGSDDSSIYFNGRIDEVRISSVVRSEDWLAAEYSNQNAPASFYVIGTQEESDAGDEAPARTLRIGGGTRLTGGVRLF
jgi:hypothetical protein